MPDQDEVIKQNGGFLTFECPKCGIENNINFAELLLGDTNVVHCTGCGREIHIAPEIRQVGTEEEVSEEEQAEREQKRQQAELTEATRAIRWTLMIENAGHMRETKYVIDGMNTIVDGSVAMLDLLCNIFLTKELTTTQFRDTVIRSAIARGYSVEMINGLIDFLAELREQRELTNATKLFKV
jgi:predicted RNA-binding Zn-ribbon protein involved in translation (DUF1610 family)